MRYNQTELLIKTEKKFWTSWNKEDECVYNAYKLLMYVLEKRLNRKNAKLEEKTPFGNDKEYVNKESLFKYFEILINEMTEKVSQSDSQRCNLANEMSKNDFIHESVADGNVIIFELEYGNRLPSEQAIKREEAIAQAKREQEEKERMLHKAKQLAKAELLRELEEQEERRLKEVKEETNQIVFPLKNYGK
ncbi:MAG: hypothetical protein HOF37_10100 [Rhodobacterales bacterium]|jgi:hypothetical protein|nr:hypothetical protein [Rhodobacterales bacterium]MBT4974683.1 hypothetical protein [Gammaproteobacteria bacterium]MBT5417142.1 hypothetical protein [Cryomorphaceae bacterium]|tara:strand:- start:100 stop:672 length:573 start_codon:yes stop_codon:yes gene_type:complete